MNEFEKLDRFVQRHKPSKEQILAPLPHLSKSRSALSLVAATVFFCVIGLGVFKVSKIKNYEEETLFVQESLEWEQEDDGLYDYYDLI